MAVGIAGEYSRSIGVDTSVGEHASQRERQALLAQNKLEKTVRQAYGKRPFAYIRYHRIPINDVDKQASFQEFARVIVHNSTVFSPKEVQLGIRVGNQYIVVDWDWEMSEKEQAELSSKLMQSPGWKWRRGWFIHEAYTPSYNGFT